MKHEYSQRWHFYSPVSCLLFWSLMWSESCSQANSFSTAELVTSRNHAKSANSESHDPNFLCLRGLIWWVCLNNNSHDKETCQSCPYSFICRWHSKIRMLYERASDQKGLTRYLEPKPGNKRDIKLGSSRDHKYFVTTGVKSTALVDFTHHAFQCFNLIQNVSAQ